MRTRATIAAVLLAAAALTACTSSEPKPAATASASKAVSPEGKFLDAIHAADIESWTDTGPSDDEIAEYPQQWCDGIAEGHSVDYLFGMTEGGLYPIGDDWGTKKADAYKVLVLGVTAYCPEYRSDVLKELRDTGEY